MKRGIFLLTVAAMIAAVTDGQITLTAKSHGFRVGDAHDFVLMKNTDEGAAGQNVVWDFSRLEVNGNSLTSHMFDVNLTDKTRSIPNSNFVLEEFGNHFIFKVSDDKMEQFGVVACNTVTTYSQPFVKMKYPFGFGDKFSGQYSGTQDNETSKTQVHGWYFVEADAFGTIILPGNVEIPNVLRVKQTKTIENTDGSELFEVTYRWYSSDVRYPVFVITKYVYPEQSFIAQTAMYAHATNQKKSAVNLAVLDPVTDINAFPNPFDEKLTISYNLNKTGVVKIDLYDVSGKLFRTVTGPVTQDAGQKSFILEGADVGIMPGILYIRIQVDNNAYLKKVVKL
jgi:hypothetical protein